jgi:molybdopterin molybdotransferase
MDRAVTLRMASVDEARAAMLAALAPQVKRETIALADAHHRVLAEDIVAQRDHPPFAASAMDGYAVRSADVPGRLNVVGEAAAGDSLGRALGAGEAARIFTGAPLPAGADAILIQEDAKREGDRIETGEALAPGVYVRPQGMDFKSGALLLKAGTRLDGIAVATAAAAGRAEIEAATRPRIALMANGDEIVPPGAAPGPYQIFDSVSFGMSALVEEWGAAAVRLPPVGDHIDALAAAFDEALSWHDMLVTLGGASVGDHDLVKPALKKLGLDLAVDTVAVRPGKPVFFGVTKRGPVLGLPGNPASALVCAHLFLRPMIRAWLGQPPQIRLAASRLGAPLPANGPREHYLRAACSIGPDGAIVAHPAESQDSSLLSVFRDANALIRLVPNAPALEQGAAVDILLLGRDAPGAGGA